jgi:hypothetical protein
MVNSLSFFFDKLVGLSGFVAARSSILGPLKRCGYSLACYLFKFICGHKEFSKTPFEISSP